MSRFGAARQFLEKKAEQKRADNSIDSLVKRAQLNELGFDLKEKPSALGGLFGGGQTLVRDPNFVSTKALERRKLENELDPNYAATLAANKEKAIMGARREAYGASGNGVMGAGGGTDQFIMTPDGRFVPNPNKPRVLNELQQAQLSDRKAKQEAAAQLKADQEESFRNSAEDNLKTIGEVKKGLKYFGPMTGNLPTAVTTIPFSKEQGERKNWESNVNKLLSQKVLDVMTELKKTSKTGSTGFGALSEKELKILENASTALNRGLSPDDASRYLNDIELVHRKVLGGGKKIGRQASGEIITGPDGKQYRIVGGDPNDPDVEPV